MPKIAYFINQYPKTSHTFIRREILALEAKGVDVFRISVWGEHPSNILSVVDQREAEATVYLSKHKKLAFFGVIISSIFTNPVRLSKAFVTTIRLRRHSGLIRSVIYLLEALALKKISTDENISHIHAHFGTNPAMVCMLCRILGGPEYSYVIHGPEEFDRPSDLALREKTYHAKFVAVVSSYGRSQLYRWLEYALWDKVKVVKCGIEPLRYRNIPAHIHNEIPSIICIGRLCEQKGQLLLIDAMAKVVKVKHVKLTLVGDGAMKDTIARRIQQLNLENFVSQLGWLSEDEVHTHLEKSLALVLPSFAEGLPVVIMEAMACKRAVISTTVAGIPELIVHSKSGFLVPPGDIQRLSESIIDLCSLDINEINTMGEYAQHRVFENHDVNTHAQTLLELILR